MSLLDQVKLAASGRWPELLCSLGGLGGDLLDGSHHPCPKCGGTDRFRAIDIEAGALFCNQCFNGKNGDGIAALQWLQGWPFKETLDKVAAAVGVAAPRGPDSKLEFYAWNEALAFSWAQKKPGISTTAIEKNGGRLARWKKRFTVVALPIHRQGKACGWAIWNTTGGKLPSAAGEAKILVTKGSKAGWIGQWALERLDAAELVWRVEGPSDMLALWTAIPEDLRARHLVVSNAFGAGEKPRDDLLETLRGRRVAVVGDLDQVGQAGAARWVTALAPVAAEVLVAKLPPGEWKDVRDWINAGGTYAQLLALAAPVSAAAPPLGPATIPPGVSTAARGESEAAVEVAEGEADDDPSRLAREYVRQRAGRVACYLDEIYYWADGVWTVVPEADLRQHVYPFLHREFQKVYRERIEEKRNQEGPPIKAFKIGFGLVTSTVAALKGYCGLPSTTRWGTELVDAGGFFQPGAERRWICCRNGILDVDALIASQPVILRKHSPLWWSPHQLPYEFDPHAGAVQRPCWEGFLAKNLENDADRITQLQEWAGYCLLPETSHQRFLIVEGEGANGKSVYLAVLEALLGPKNVSHVPLELWRERFALCSTLGKLANLASEVGDLDKVAEGYLKAFVAGDAMTFDRKGRDAIDARPTARLVIATNNRPRFSDRSKGLWRRMLLIPFLVEIQESERVIGMDDPAWWIRSGEMPGILNWALEGLLRLKLRGQFSESEAGRAAMEEYRAESNPAREFLRDYYQADQQEIVCCTDAYKKYAEFCEASGYRALGDKTFGKEVRRAFPLVTRIHIGPRGLRSWAYAGIRERVGASSF